MTAPTTVPHLLAQANEAALTAYHEAHADRVRAVHAVTKVARCLAAQHAPRHDEGLYALSDPERLYARRLLLQATAAMFAGTVEGRMLAAMDAWLTLGGRCGGYTEADALAMEKIADAVTEAATAILGEIIDAAEGVGRE